VSYQEMCKLGSAELTELPCRCIRCDACHGSGRISVRSFGYPEDDIESCDECRGAGISESCDRCQLLDEFDQDDAL
jgi:DnaJ-class molecular chaperone